MKIIWRIFLLIEILEFQTSLFLDFLNQSPSKYSDTEHSVLSYGLKKFDSENANQRQFDWPNETFFHNY